jgi:rhodanese-related sulfurtransferase
MLLAILLAVLTNKADVPRVEPAELRALLDKGEAIAVDVRGSVPFELGHIAGATWMPLGLMSQRGGELPEDKLIVTYCTCKVEETSLEAAMLLSSLGFPRVAVLHGGYPAWKAAGFATEANQEPEETGSASAPASAPSASGRLAPPAAVACKRDNLTVYAGSVRSYHRQKDKTTITIATTAGTVEKVTLHHPGSDDPSRFYLINSTPFTPSDWNRLERRKGELLPDMGARAWVCKGGPTIIDWLPGAKFGAAE